jgi:hypothetical protein
MSLALSSKIFQCFPVVECLNTNCLQPIQNGPFLDFCVAQFFDTALIKTNVINGQRNRVLFQLQRQDPVGLSLSDIIFAAVEPGYGLPHRSGAPSPRS